MTDVVATVLRKLQRAMSSARPSLCDSGMGAAQAFPTGASGGRNAVCASWFLVAAAIGFPFWIAFAWFYELTPEGIRRESDVDADKSILKATGRRLDSHHRVLPSRSCFY